MGKFEMAPAPSGGQLGVDLLVRRQLDAHLAELERLFQADCLTSVGPIAFQIDDVIRDEIEGLQNKKEKLIFIIESNGGYAETARRISDTLRHHYKFVEFIIPSYAMSAATILVMSGDAFHMDYYSVLGPIDPQVDDGDGNLIPALGYLIRYEELLDKANKGNISSAELNILLSFDQGKLYSYEQGRDLSRSLLEEWLVKYKFKDWQTTETHGRPVTPEMKKDRATDIANKLNDTRRWNSHGMGISMDILKSDINLKVEDFGADACINNAIKTYHKLLLDYMAVNSYIRIVHTRENWRYGEGG
jgi:Serine dehydrogenase proteinase